MASRSTTSDMQSGTGVAERPGGCFRVAMAEDRLSGHDDARAGPNDVGNVAGVDATVDFDRRLRAGRAEHLAHPAHLVQAVRNERLAAEAGVDRHDEDEVDQCRDVLEHQRRRGRTEYG